jgi:hypothetical protein
MRLGKGDASREKKRGESEGGRRSNCAGRGGGFFCSLPSFTYNLTNSCFCNASNFNKIGFFYYSKQAMNEEDAGRNRATQEEEEERRKRGVASQQKQSMYKTVNLRVS